MLLNFTYKALAVQVSSYTALGVWGIYKGGENFVPTTGVFWLLWESCFFFVSGIFGIRWKFSYRYYFHIVDYSCGRNYLWCLLSEAWKEGPKLHVSWWKLHTFIRDCWVQTMGHSWGCLHNSVWWQGMCGGLFKVTQRLQTCLAGSAPSLLPSWAIPQRSTPSCFMDCCKL